MFSKHPISGKHILWYMMVWACYIVLQAIFVAIYTNGNYTESLIITLPFNIFLAGFGLMLWFTIPFLSTQFQRLIVSIISHIIIGSISLYLAMQLSALIESYLILSYNFDATMLQFIEPIQIISGALCITIVVAVYYLLLFRSFLSTEEKRKQELEVSVKNYELALLKSQINPHFIFNSLNTISSLTISAPGQAREMVVKLADFFRFSLGKNIMKLHTLKEELDQMALYLEIEKVRFGDRLSYQLDVDEACLQWPIPNMLLQPLYENAVKFGIYEQLEDVHISLLGNCSKDVLQLSICNNYDNSGMAKKGNGIGLQNVSKRLSLIYGASNLIAIEKEKNIFKVHLKIPRLTT